MDLGREERCGESHAMDTDLTAVKAELGELSEDELHALIAASNGVR